ncbi:MAG: glycosyltransferase [Desulfovibrionales bacterium]|nr:glycosyltransferase [Desulfovibrionales bacterium]
MHSQTIRRILLVPPFCSSQQCIVAGCRDALTAQGHVVLLFDAAPANAVLHAAQTCAASLARREELQEQAAAFVDTAVIAAAEHMRADVVVTFPHSALSAHTLSELHVAGIATVCWMTEDFAAFPYWRAAVSGYDIVATIQHEPLISELGVLGHEAVYLPFAANDSCCTPVCTQTAVEGMIVVLGDASEELAEALRPYIPRGIVIWGKGWEYYPDFASSYQGTQESLTRSQRKALYRDAAIVVNLHSATFDRGDFVNLETFAIAACGGFQLVDKRTLMEGMFGYDALVQFETAEELADLLAEFINDAASRRAYAQRGQQHVLANHTYAVRMATLMDAVERVHPDSQGASVTIPEDVAALIVRVAKEYGLPEESPLEILLDALEQRDILSGPAVALQVWAMQAR